MASTDTPEVALAETESLAAEGEIAETEAFAEETGESDFVETDLTKLELPTLNLKQKPAREKLPKTKRVIKSMHSLRKP